MFAQGVRRSTGRVLREQARRTLFTVPELPHIDASKGVPGLYTPQGLDVAWFQTQRHFTDKLNELTRENPEVQELTMYELLKQAGDDPALNEIHYYASLAYSNEFFFNALRQSSVNPDATAAPPTAQEQRQVDISDKVRNAIDPTESPTETQLMQWLSNNVKDHFDSQLGLRELMLNRAAGAFGSGNVWLVETNKYLFVLNTYNHGTPYEPTAKRASSSSSSSSSDQGEMMGDAVSKLTPLLNIPTWQHSFLTDYGVAGKRKFLQNVYDTIDWKVVARRLRSTDPKYYDSGRTA